MRILILYLLVVAPFLLTPLVAGQDELAGTIQELRSLPPEEPYAWGEVPVRARSLLRTVKGQLLDAASGALPDAVTPEPSLQAVRDDIVRSLDLAGVVVGEDPDWQNELGYGYVLDVSVSRPPAQPRLIAVLFTLSITCGSDSTLYLFANREGSWEVAFEYVADGYETIYDAFSHVSYLVSPRDEAGKFFVVTANIPAWCTSIWHPLRFDVFSVPGSGAQAARLLTVETELTPVTQGYELALLPDGFSVSYKTFNPEDTGTYLARTDTYRVTGSTVTRVCSEANDG